jgi:hypothetical protein
MNLTLLFLPYSQYFQDPMHLCVCVYIYIYIYIYICTIQSPSLRESNPTFSSIQSIFPEGNFLFDDKTFKFDSNSELCNVGELGGIL